jgi:hypothetical protein
VKAIIGRYRARMEETGLILSYATDISFDLTMNETLGLPNLLSIYRQTLLEMQEDQDKPEKDKFTDNFVYTYGQRRREIFCIASGMITGFLRT